MRVSQVRFGHSLLDIGLAEGRHRVAALSMGRRGTYPHLLFAYRYDSSGMDARRAARSAENEPAPIKCTSPTNEGGLILHQEPYI
jgi:hypothetical protein